MNRRAFLLALPFAPAAAAAVVKSIAAKHEPEAPSIDGYTCIIRTNVKQYTLKSSTWRVTMTEREYVELKLARQLASRPLPLP